jgi:hypothetical protein
VTGRYFFGREERQGGDEHEKHEEHFGGFVLGYELGLDRVGWRV